MSKKLIYLTSFVLVLSLVGSASAGLPTGWSSRDIGWPGASGSANESGSTWTVRGDGHDIWGSSDAFHFAYVPLSGDGMIVARVVDNGYGSNSWAKGGVMIRETLVPGSKHVMMIMTGGEGNGKAFQCRPITGSSSLSSHGGTQVSPPMWIKLTREGNIFTGYYSTDGVNWVQQPDGTGGDMTPNHVEIYMARNVYIGLCVTSHADGQVRTFTFDNVHVGWPNWAIAPSPADGAFHQDTWASLSWFPGDTAISHDVYFGDNFDDVNDGTGSTFQGNQTATSFTVGLPGFPYPDGLVQSTTYYWRIDEVNDIHPDSPWKGDVWSFTVAEPLSEALDTALSFTTGGSADWFSQTTTSRYDGDAAQSPDISHRQESWMQTTVSGTGTIQFYWKVSSEEDFDFLEFYIDGSLQDQISGLVNWEHKTYTISTSGSHTLEWRYVKDGSGNSGSDCGWVDKVEWVTN